MDHKNDVRSSEFDVEMSTLSDTSASHNVQTQSFVSRLRGVNARIEKLSGVEVQCLERVPPDQRLPPSTMGHLQMLLVWFSANLTVNNLAVALTGPLLFKLGE